MTDQQRERCIKSLAGLIECFMAYNQVGRAKDAYELMRQLIRGRSVAQIIKMEQEKGLV